MCMIENLEQYENLLGNAAALWDSYIEQIYEAKDMQQWLGATHWYADACSSLIRDSIMHISANNNV